MWEILSEKKEKIIFLGAAAVLFLIFRYVFPLIWPFLLGGILAAVLYPAIRFLNQKLRIRKGICTMALLASVVALMVCLLGLCGYGIIEKGYEVFCDYERYMAVVEARADDCCDWVEDRLHLENGVIMKEVKGTMTRMSHSFQDNLVGGVFTGSMSGAKKMLSVGLFFVFMFLSTVLIVKEWDEKKDGAFLYCRIYLERVREFFKIFLGAQIRIIGVIALICLIGFWIAGVEGALPLAIVTACLDVLPFIGTGIILVPLILWRVVNAQYYQAFLLLATYICCMIAREYLEPKFISAKTGISPIFTLMGIYVGVKLLGIGGIFLGPLYILFVQILYDEIVRKKSFVLKGE